LRFNVQHSGEAMLMLDEQAGYRRQARAAPTCWPYSTLTSGLPALLCQQLAATNGLAG
jgi:hypothetical protein